MTLVFAGVASHAPGITARAERADPAARDAFYAAYGRMREAIRASGAEALLLVGAEHFANFFMDNMPAYCIGMAEDYEGPIEDPDWLKIPRGSWPGDPELSRRIIEDVMQAVDVAYAEEWKFDHGMAVPLHFLSPDRNLTIVPANINCQGPPLTPLRRAWEFGRALRRACDAAPERIALVGTGGISHWPATPNSGRINEAWDRDFLEKWSRNDRDALLSYTDEETLRDAGQGGFEIRTFIAVSGATERARADVWFYQPIPIFAVGCTIGVVDLASAAAQQAAE